MPKRKKRPQLPDSITDDPDVFGEFKVAFSEAVASAMDESDWKKFAIRYGLDDEILSHPRFLRSMQWGDADYEGHVLDLIDHLCSANVPAIIHLMDEIPSVRRNLDQRILDAWDGQVDPLVTALSHSLETLDSAASGIDLGAYAARVEDALPHDPQQAIGATKDLLEATMRTILDGSGVSNTDKLDFPELTNTCFSELGLLPSTKPKNQAEGKIRKIADNAKKMILASNELRNLAGTGHGRVVGKEEELTADDASLVASNGMVLAAWLLRRADLD
ncbi:MULTISPECIES: abortive infection family protein [Phaeobacter]|uniref:abortive infection family protein n=3 Tax=Phaeobacter TaxID=302485 RepID=UPI003A842397